MELGLMLLETVMPWFVLLCVGVAVILLLTGCAFGARELYREWRKG